MTKDYYRILGVLDDAEEIVIRAAYKALAQRYHPDKWTGSKDEANRRMSDINEAYGVLSDPVKRKQYDATRKKSEYEDSANEGETEDEILSSIESDWKDVVEYFPDLEKFANNLSKISKQLAFTYKTILLERKDFNQREEIARVLETNYLQKFFGTNKKIIDFAKMLILKGNKKVAKELNKAINLLGTKVDADVIINKLLEKYPLEFNELNSEHAIKYAQQLVRYPSYYYAKNFIEELRGTVFRSNDEDVIKIYFASQNYQFSEQEFIKFANIQAINYLSGI